MAEEAAAADRVQQLEQQLATLQAKLQKSDTVKKKLREHLALLKEKAINSLALVEEQVLLQQEHAKLQQQYADASAAVSQLQQAAQEAEAAKHAAEAQYHAVLQDLKTAEGKLRSAEKNFSSTLRASMKAKQAVKERDEALAGMKAMQQQIQQLQLAVRQLQRGQAGQQQNQPAAQGDESPQQQQQQQQQQPPRTATVAQQQQLMQKVKQLESWVQGLQDIDIEIDVNDMYSQLQRSVIDVLNAKIDSRLDGLQQRLAELQQQQKAAEASPAVAASTAAAAAFRSPLDRPATQRDVQQLQQQMEALAAQQQHWHALLQRMFAERTAAATGGMQGLHQDESFCILPAVASAGPTREASPAVAAAFGHSSGAVASSSEAAATAVASAVATARNAPAAVAAAPASTATCTRGSSMFGTTALVVGGTNSSYGDGHTDAADRMLQAGSPSVGTATPRHSAQQQRHQQQQQEQLIGEKRQRDSEQQQQEEEEEDDDDDEEGELDPWDAFLESNDMQLQLPDAAPQKQQQQQRRRPQGGTDCGTDSASGPSKRARAAAATASDAAATQTSLHAFGSTKQGQYAAQPRQQQELMEQLQTVRVQPEAAADVAQQLANALEAGRVSEQVLLDSFSASFLLGAALEYDASQLKHALASLQNEQCLQTGLLQLPSAGSGGTCSNQLQWQQQLQHLCTAGWVASSGAGAAALHLVFEAQQNLAECACKLSVALEQQHREQQQPRQQQQQQQEHQQARQQQQPCAVEDIQQSSISHAQEPCHWPALAECWQADQTVPVCSCGSAAQQHSSGISQLNSGDERLGVVHKLACHVMAPLYKSVSQLGASVFGEQQQQHATQALQQQQRGVNEQQQQQQQRAVHESNVAQACAAAAAAAHLYKAVGDQHRYLQLIARLLSMAAAYNWSNLSSSSHTGSYQDSSAACVITAGGVTVPMHTDATSQAVAAVAAAREGAAAAAAAAGERGRGGESDRGGCGLRAGAVTAAAAQQCSKMGIACLLAAAGAWPAALQFDTAAADAVLIEGGVPTMPNKAHCVLCSSKSSAAVAERAAGSDSCLFWRWLVLHPGLVAVRCCLQYVCDTAATAALPADSLIVTAPALCNDSTGVQQLAAALQLLLRLAAAGHGATRSTAAENAKELSGVAGAAGDGCVAVDSLAAAICLPAPGELLGCLLGILKQLLQKQLAALPPGRQLPPFQGACEAAVATFCAAGSVVSLFVPQQKVAALLKDFRSSLGGDVSEWPVHVQRLLNV